jgi:hypothetical protein
MGYIRHQATIISAITRTDCAREVAIAVSKLRDEMPPEFARLIVGPVEATVNGDLWWVMLPDGSKEGWSTSKLGETYRKRFSDLAPYGAVNVAWGDDDAIVIEDPYEYFDDPNERALDDHRGNP